MENVMYLLRGFQSNVLPEENHQEHLEIHKQIQTIPEFQQLLPAQQQQVLQIAQQHMQQHEQFLQQMAQGQGQGQQPAAGRIPGVRERSGSEGNIVSLVRSQAQEMSQAVQRAPGQN